MANMTFKANLLPDNTASQRELGSSTAKWAINGVADPKLTDTLPTINTTGDGNAITAITISGSTITVTKGSTFNNYTYTLPTASSSTKGGIKVGTGLSISSDTLSVSTTSGTSTLEWNSEVTLGTVGGLAIKAKLPANPNTNTHRPIQMNGTEILGNNTTALNLKAGSNVTLSNSSGTVTIASTNTTYTAGTGLSLSGTTFNHSNSITAKTAAAQSAKTLTWGGTFTIYEEKYDAQGHVTGVASYNMTMPANPNSDTKNTAGSTDISTKIFLVGAASQAASAQTYSDNQVYVTNGQLDANVVQVATHVKLQYNTTTNALDFVFV